MKEYKARIVDDIETFGYMQKVLEAMFYTIGINQVWNVIR